MIADSQIKFDYSSEVRMWLEADGQTWPIAKLGPDHFVPAIRFDLTPCEGEIVMMVDSDQRRWNVRLRKGVCYFDASVPVEMM